MPIELFQKFAVCSAPLLPILELGNDSSLNGPVVLGSDPAASCERLNALTSEALNAPLTALKDLRVPLEDKLRDAGENPSPEDMRKLELIVKLEPFEKRVKELEKQIQRPDALLLCRALRKELVSAGEKGDVKALKGWDEKFDKLTAYAKAETKMRLVLEWAQNRYPQNGRFTFELDFTSDNGRVGRYLDTCRASGPCEGLSQLEPDIDYYKHLELVQVYRELKDSSNEEDRKAADMAEEAISHYKFLTNSLNSFFLGRQYEVTPSWEALDHMTEMIEATYGAPELRTFLQKVEEKEKANLENNEGYQARMEFAKSAEVLEKFDAYLNVLKRPFGEVENSIDAEMLGDYRKLLQQRATSYQGYLESEEKRLQSIANNAAGVPDETYAGTDMAPPPAEATPELAAVREKLDRVRTVIEGLSQRPDGLQADFEALAAVTPEIAEMEDAHARGLVERLLSFLPDSAPPAKADLSELSSDKTFTYKEKAAICRAVEMDIRSRLVLSMVDGRIKQYEAFQDEKETRDGIVNVMKAPFELLQGPEPESRYPDPPAPEVTNWQMIHAYREIQGKLASEDEGIRKQGLADFQALESISGHKTLYEAYQGNAMFVGMTAGVGIVIAAAATGGLAAAAAGPLLGLAEGSLALTAINATVFTLTCKTLDAVLRGKNVFDEIFQASTLLEIGLNTGMFSYMNRAMARFEKVFEKGLEFVARRNLVKSLGRALVEEDSALLSSEVNALREGAGVQLAKTAGGFAYEAVKFQQWGFYVDVGRRTLAGDSSPIENALKSTASGDAFLHNAQFLLGLKMAHVLATPVLGPAYEAVHGWAMGKTVERSLKSIDADIQGLQEQMDDVFVSGKGDLSKIASQLDDRLRMREELIGQIPEAFQNDHFKAVKDFHHEVRADLAKLRGLAEGMNEALGPGNAFGVKAAAGEGDLGSSLTYDPAKKDAFRASFNKLVGGRNVKVLGSVIEATFRFPGGVEQTLVFTPAEAQRATVRQLPAAKRAAPKVRAVENPYESNQMAAE